MHYDVPINFTIDRIEETCPLIEVVMEITLVSEHSWESELKYRLYKLTQTSI